MPETRSAKYGRLLAEWINETIGTIPEEDREGYRLRLIEELKNYSSPHLELKDLNNLDISNPEDLAMLVKEGLHLMYQSTTSNNALDALLEELE